MANKTINSRGSVSLQEAVRVVDAIGDTNALLFVGEPGIGKTAIHTMRKEGDTKNEYCHIYIDATNKDPADLAINMPVHESKQLESYLAALLQPNDPRPKEIMVDELGKGTTMLKQMLARLFHEHVVGDTKLPKGSRVFATTNNATDGVGDSFAAHLANRLTIVAVRKPTVAAWCSHASDMNIDALIRTCLMLNPSMLDSYTSLSDEELKNNPYIFNPAMKQRQFVSPRSLSKCDAIVKNRRALGDDVTRALLAGTAGEPFAQMFMTFQDFEKHVHTPEQIIADPKKISVPENEGALWHMINKAVDFIKTQDHLSAYMTYVKRFPRMEHQGIFFSMIVHSNKTSKLADHNNEITTWGANNYDLFM
jgi:hypothetical protein